MKFEKCEIKGLILCKPKIINDKRGFFTETFRKDLFQIHFFYHKNYLPYTLL